MRRRLFTAMSVLSLVACLTTAVLWVRSCFVADQVAGGLKLTTDPITQERVVSRAMEVTHYAGRLLVRHAPAMMVYKNNGRWWYRRLPVAGMIADVDNLIFSRPRLAFAGFRFSTVSDGELNLLIPDYALTLLFVALPAVWVVSRLRRIGSRPGLCTSCGYNLTGNTGGVCPECGTATAGVKA